MYILFASNDTPQQLDTSPQTSTIQQYFTSFSDAIFSKEAYKNVWRPCLSMGVRIAPVIMMYYVIRREAHAFHEVIAHEKEQLHQLISDEKAALYARIDTFESKVAADWHWLEKLMKSLVERFENNKILQWL